MNGVVVQAPNKTVRRDGDGHFLFSTPCSFYIQKENGEPVGEEYSSIFVDSTGEVVSLDLNDRTTTEEELIDFILDFADVQLKIYREQLGTLENPFGMLEGVETIEGIKEKKEKLEGIREDRERTVREKSDKTGELETAEDYKQAVLKKLEEANQLLGEWSEQTDSNMLLNVLVAEVHNIDNIGNEIKDIKT